jgi:hypothetical protein
MAATAAVTAVRPAPGDIFLPPEAYRTIAALPGGNQNPHFINEHFQEFIPTIVFSPSGKFPAPA